MPQATCTRGQIWVDCGGLGRKLPSLANRINRQQSIPSPPSGRFLDRSCTRFTLVHLLICLLSVHNDLSECGFAERNNQHTPFHPDQSRSRRDRRFPFNPFAAHRSLLGQTLSSHLPGSSLSPSFDTLTPRLKPIIHHVHIYRDRPDHWMVHQLVVCYSGVFRMLSFAQR